MIAKGFTRCSERCEKIRSELVQAVPAIEVDRAYYLTQSYNRKNICENRCEAKKRYMKFRKKNVQDNKRWARDSTIIHKGR